MMTHQPPEGTHFMAQRPGSLKDRTVQDAPQCGSKLYVPFARTKLRTNILKHAIIIPVCLGFVKIKQDRVKPQQVINITTDRDEMGPYTDLRTAFSRAKRGV
jgi:hypothetical protein